MPIDTINYPTLAAELWGRQRRAYPAHPLARALLLAVAGSLLLALSAQVEIPLVPVPITMQTFVVLVIGVAYGWRLGALTLLLYLVEGAAGLPVFAGGAAGIGVLVGPTGGYLLGFVVAAAVCGWLAEKGWGRRPTTTFAAMFIGTLIIYAFGLMQLGTVIGWDKPVLELGLYPFLVGDLLKIALAMVVLPGAWKAIGRRSA